MQVASWAEFGNGQGLPLEALPLLGAEAFRDAVLAQVAEGARVVAWMLHPAAGPERRLVAVLAQGSTGMLAAGARAIGESYPALTPDCPQLHLFERELFERWDVRPVGHPWLKPVRRVPPDARDDDFFRMAGEEVHEVAVGPVHAGIIEPGHFRFQCHGEHVFHLEIALGYQHRGVERALLGGPTKRTLPAIETLAGDTSVGHALAYAQTFEALANSAPPARAQCLRGIALELERLANHTGDLGALSGDVGFLPTAAYCGRLRGEFLNLTALACGSRLGRGWIRPGGVACDLEESRAERIAGRLQPALADALGAVDLLRSTSTVRARFEETGPLSAAACQELGVVGVPARASGLARDARWEFPTGVYATARIPVATWPTGDVFARARVRWMEMERSVAFLEQQLPALPDGPLRLEPGRLRPVTLAVSLVEGWRGEICHAAITDGAGRFAAYQVVDPSFHNWAALALALRGQAISDFPLCNKSFNLSYCGHDL
ncbi:MAG TPA: hypothetical protein VJS92_14380 [Candidatus Polarisedimenticolaceae bacterium]|nr:hypothetical protein [Candidatus Polarisedimenticolaceae bacterium]